MRIDSINDYKEVSFKGRIHMPNEKFFTKMIDDMDFFEREKAVKKLVQEEQKNTPIVEKGLFDKIKDLFSKKQKPQTPVKQKTLNDFWNHSLNNMKMLFVGRLSDDYVLRCRKSNLRKGHMTFRITKGREYIYGVSANIDNPKFPEKQIDAAIEKISQGYSPWS